MIETAPFGATGHDSSRVIFGAAALGGVSKGDADRTLDMLLEHGINHIDVAASYGDAELRIASWLRRHPGTFFLATKTGERTYRGAREEIRRSLDRLGVDRVDSIQLHNLVDVIEWDTALSADGALEAAVEAREEGLVRFIGVTGHGLSVPEMHRRSLERHLRLRARALQLRADAGPAVRRDVRGAGAVCAERNVALQTIKSLARRRWDGREHTRGDLVRAAARAGPTSISRCTGCSAGPRPPGDVIAAARPRRAGRRRDPLPPGDCSAALPTPTSTAPGTARRAGHAPTRRAARHRRRRRDRART